MGDKMKAYMFPVCTGMNRCTRINPLKSENVPRMHGDEPSPIVIFEIPMGCSPYARG